MTEATQTATETTILTQAQPAAPAETQQPEGQNQKTLLGETQEKDATTEAQSTAPEKYELTAPDGMAIDAKMLEAMSPVFKEMNLSQEQVQKLADTYAPMIKAQAEAQHSQVMKDYDALTDGWRQDTIKDLGADYAKKLAPASAIINKFPQGKEFRELLEETRLGNHPLMNKFLIFVGQSIRPDSFPDHNKTTVHSGASAADLLFPNTPKTT